MRSGVNWRKKNNHVFATLTICHYNVRFHRYADDTQVYISNEPTTIARFSRWVKDRVDLTPPVPISATLMLVFGTSCLHPVTALTTNCPPAPTSLTSCWSAPPPTPYVRPACCQSPSHASAQRVRGRSAALLLDFGTPPTCLQLPTFSCQFCPCCAFAVLFLVF